MLREPKARPTPQDELDEALAELIRQGRVEVVKDAEGRDVYRLVRN
jgi:hypothetical protein